MQQHVLLVVVEIMSITLLYLGAAVTGLLFRQVMSFQLALAGLSQRMAVLEDRGVKPIIYQNSITPPWVTNVWLALVVSIICLAIAAGYLGGVLDALISIVVTVAAVLVSGALNVTLATPKADTYYRMAFHSLSNRSANYKRDGDALRAEAADEFLSLMISTAGENVILG